AKRAAHVPPLGAIRVVRALIGRELEGPARRRLRKILVDRRREQLERRNAERLGGFLAGVGRFAQEERCDRDGGDGRNDRCRDPPRPAVRADVHEAEPVENALQASISTRRRATRAPKRAGASTRRRHGREPQPARIDYSLVFSGCAGTAAIVSRETQTSWPRPLRISMFHTWLDRPMCTGRAVPVTTSPTGTGRR